MRDENLKSDPTHVEYWVMDAGKLKQAADLSWAAKDNIRQNSENAKLFGLDQPLIEAAEDAELELNWLYPNLISFAIQHLAIGILLSRNPQLIIRQGSHFPIAKLVQECGVQIKPEIKEILDQVENSFKWSDKIPRWSVRLSAEQIQTLKRHRATMDVITLGQKHDFDALYDELKTMALKEVAVEEGANPLQDSPQQGSSGQS
jgi:hypothetical protein